MLIPDVVVEEPKKTDPVRDKRKWAASSAGSMKSEPGLGAFLDLALYSGEGKSFQVPKIGTDTIIVHESVVK
jgi:hypothetical protein